MDRSRTLQTLLSALICLSACNSSKSKEEQPAPAAAAASTPAPAAAPAPASVLAPAPASTPAPASSPAQPAAKAATPAAEEERATTPSPIANPKIFIEPEKGGFDSYIAAGFVRKKTPVIVTKNRAEADYILSSTVSQEREDTGGKVARCIFADCVGIEGNQTASVQLADPAGKVVWAYNVRKNGSESFQSSAEAIAKHLKEFLEPKPPKKPKRG